MLKFEYCEKTTFKNKSGNNFVRSWKYFYFCSEFVFFLEVVKPDIFQDYFSYFNIHWDGCKKS